MKKEWSHIWHLAVIQACCNATPQWQSPGKNCRMGAYEPSMAVLYFRVTCGEGPGEGMCGSCRHSGGAFFGGSGDMGQAKRVWRVKGSGMTHYGWLANQMAEPPGLPCE